MAFVWQVLQEDPQCPSRVVLEKVAQRQVPIAVSVRHLNRLRVQWRRNRQKGRPGQRALSRPGVAGGAVAHVTPHLSCVGVPLFAHGLDQQHGLVPVVAGLTQAIEAYEHTHPDDDCALVPHREQTLLRRFPALFFAPLVGIETLTGFETHAHPLPTLLGRGSHSATLRQLLGQRERVNAAEALRPALVPDKAVQITSVDGPMLASGSRVPMHNGTITMLGRIMAGSQAVIAPSEAGQALFVPSYPPDRHVSQGIVAYGHKVGEATGHALFVIDRAVNAVALARACDTQGWGVLCMLDANEPEGLDSFEATLVATRADGTTVSRGEWKAPRPDDPRHVVLVEPTGGKTLVSWGTPAVKDACEVSAWPRGSREGNARQENRCKRLLDHGALKTNSGRTKIVSAGRHQQRAQETLDQALGVAPTRVDKRAEALKAHQAKGAASEHHGHGTRLAQRQRALVLMEKALQDAQAHQATRTAHASALGPPRERADRDFRTQTIMTVRTLLLEHALTAFMAGLLGHLNLQVRLDCLLKILFERRGARMEPDSQVVYWVNTTGLSVASQRLLTQVADGLCAMDLRHQGKPMRVRLRDMPP